MSINLCVSAEVLVTLPNGKTKQITEDFDLFQTSTSLTDRAIKSGDPYKVYKEWIKSLDYDDSGEHLKELDDWLKSHNEEGWTIEWYSL